ncbi:N-acetylornithine carbamoyltransferase [Ascidiimonas aurantiaca]|uniref:N-acetylornithine carbamoyltransferase n=1 Tax=Ascidiimonas aurantiaca TaxID=1685432 RepID=UPI0030EBBD34
MKHFLDLNAIDSLPLWLEEAVELKKAPHRFANLGKHKTLGLLFFNPSLRTRLSTQKAAQLLGMHTLVINVSGDAWALEFEDGTIMNGNTSEHVKEAAGVISQYCDMIGIRAFPELTDREKDASEMVLNSFYKYASVPIINMESATAHPLQALADALTIYEHSGQRKPKVVLSWAPHPKALPQAVANSFVEIMQLMKVDFNITHPEGYELKNTFTQNIRIEYDQEKAFAEADFVYVKNWSSYQQYGKVLHQDPEWTITSEKMKHTNNAYFMHCLPVRRNVVVTDAVLDSNRSLVMKQAANRTYAAQLVLKKLLENE